MAASKYTQRMHAMEFAIASSSPEDSPKDIVTRAQVYADWLSGAFAVEIKYVTSDEADPATDAANVLPMKPKKP
jgi:hypothetical protein